MTASSPANEMRGRRAAPGPRRWYDKRPLVALAPMEGITDQPFRRVCRELSPHTVLFTEFANAKGLLHGSDGVWRMVSFAEMERPLVVQLFGSEPDDLAAAARAVEERGQPDGIDINFGCPVKKVLQRGEGCALMRDPARAGEIVRAVKRAVGIPVSAKMRLGWESPEEAVPFARALEEGGVEALTVHGRLRREGYRHPASWEAIARVKAALSIPVIGNGDIIRGEDARRRWEESGVDGIMVARGALGNPWLPEEAWAALAGGEARGRPPLGERVRILLHHLDLNIDRYGEYRGVINMRKHFGRYLTGFPGARELRHRLMGPTTREEVRVVLEPLIGAD